MNCHEDPQLNKLVGKRVKARICGETYTGILEKGGKEYPGKYKIGNLCFYKSHVGWIQEE